MVIRGPTSCWMAEAMAEASKSPAFGFTTATHCVLGRIGVIKAGRGQARDDQGLMMGFVGGGIGAVIARVSDRLRVYYGTLNIPPHVPIPIGPRGNPPLLHRPRENTRGVGRTERSARTPKPRRARKGRSPEGSGGFRGF